MNWIDSLKGLPETVAILALFTACVVLVVKAIARYIADPIKDAINQMSNIVDNHFEHDKEDRRDERIARDEQVSAFRSLTEEIKALLRQCRGGGNDLGSD